MPDPQRPLKVFLCHASTDKPKVRELYRYLKKRGIQPWFDEEDLVGGQDWQIEIPKALATSDAIIICLTKNSVDKEGYIQKEIKFALDKALEMPEGRIFLIPVKFEECEVPFTLSRYHWVDLTVESGYAKMMKALKFRASQLDRSTVEVSKKDVEEENLAREKAEKEAAEKGQLEPEELAIQKDEKEKAEREATERAEKERKAKELSEKQVREVREKEKRESEKKEEKPVAAKSKAKKKEEKPVAAKSKARGQPAYWFVGFVILVLGIILLSSLSNLPRTVKPTPAISQSFPTSTNTLSVDLEHPSPQAQLNQTPTALSEVSSNLEEIKQDNLGRLTELNSWKADDYIYAVEWAPDSSKFAVHPYQKDIYLYDLQGNISTLPGTKDLWVLNYSADGALVAVEVGASIILHNYILLKDEVKEFRGHTGTITSLILSSDGKLLISGSSDNSIRVWQTSDSSLLRTFVGHQNDIGYLALSPDSKIIVSSSEDCTIRLWDIPNDKLLYTIQLKDCISRPVEFSPDGRIFASYLRALWRGENSVALWGVSDGNLIKTLECQNQFNGLSDIQFSPDGFLLIKNCLPDVALWNVSDNVAPTIFSGLSLLDDILFANGNKILIGTSGSGSISFYDTGTGSLLHTIKTGSRLTTLSLSPDGTILMGADYDKNIYLWGVRK